MARNADRDGKTGCKILFSIFSQNVGLYLKYQWSNKPLLIFLKIYSFGTKKQENILQLRKSTKCSNSNRALVYRDGWTWRMDTKNHVNVDENNGLCQKVR